MELAVYDRAAPRFRRRARQRHRAPTLGVHTQGSHNGLHIPSLPPPPDIVSQPTPHGSCDMRKIACPLVATACTPCRRPCPIVTTSNRRPTSPRTRDRASQFYQNTVFNRDLSGWNVGKVTTMAYMVRRSRAKLGDAAASPPLRLVITPSRLRLLYHLAMNWITHRKVRT